MQLLICKNCQQEIRPGARYCGTCGRAAEVGSDVRPGGETVGTKATDPGTAGTGAAGSSAAGNSAAPPSSGTPLERFADSLRKIGEALAAVPVSPLLGEGVRVLATGPRREGHRTVFVGERARGKTTLVNRLLGREILPTGRSALKEAVKLREGATWRALVSDDDPREVHTSPPFPGNDTAAYALVEGPSHVLVHTTIVDTPGMNDTEDDFDEVVIRAVMGADLVVVCLSAAQLLAETERIAIERRLLPVAGGRVVLAVTFAERLETEEDRRDAEKRLARFAAKHPESDLVAIVVPTATPAKSGIHVLEDLILDSVEERRSRFESKWVEKSGTLLAAVDVALRALESDDPDAAARAGGRDLESVRRMLADEHLLALRETEAQVRSRLASLRLALPERLAKLSTEAARHEGVSTLLGEVQSLGRDAGRFYLAALERSITTSVPIGDADSLAELRASSVTNFASLGVSEMPGDVKGDPRPPIDGKVTILSALGAVMVIMATSWLSIVGGTAALYAAHQSRGKKRSELGDGLKKNAAATLQQWLTNVEPELLAGIGTASGRILRALDDRVTALFGGGGAATGGPVLSPALVRAEVAECRAACAALRAELERSGK